MQKTRGQSITSSWRSIHSNLATFRKSGAANVSPLQFLKNAPQLGVELLMNYNVEKLATPLLRKVAKFEWIDLQDEVIDCPLFFFAYEKYVLTVYEKKY